MQKYQILSKAGSGNFANVYKARNRITNEVVAIKEMKHSDDSEQLTHKELQIITQIKHPNIIKLKQIITQKKDVSIIFEYMEETLLELYQSSRLGINQNQVKCIMFQAASALEYLHKCKIIHRDIKPENLLIDRKLALVKLIDFGLSKQDYLASTDYVATRWYRAPENLIGMRKSSTSMDIFALGCVTAQLICQNPLFPGENTIDQLKKIFNLLGTPTIDNWPDGYLQMKRKGIIIPSKVAMSLKFALPTASTDLLNLLDQMLQLNPAHRITAGQILLHPFFQNVQKFIPELIYKQFLKKRYQYEKTKTPNLSIVYSSPVHLQKNSTSTSNLSTQTTHKYFKSPHYLATPSRNNQQNKNSRLSIQTGKMTRDLSTDSKKSIPKHWQLRKTPMKLQISEVKNQNPLQRTHSKSQQEKAIRHYFSRENLSTSSLQKSHKTKFFDTKGDSRYVIKALQDQIKFNARNTDSRNESIKISDQISKPSQRYNVKYFRQANNDRGRDRFQNSRNQMSQRYEQNLNIVDKKRNVGTSLQLNYISKSKIFKSKTNLNKPLLKGSYKRNY